MSFHSTFSRVQSTSAAAPGRTQRPTHERTRSVRFPIEPVARDTQREMELELQRWVGPALQMAFSFTASARGAVSVRRCETPAGEKVVVLKTVAITLPSCRDGNNTTITTATTAISSGLGGFSSTDRSSDLSGNLLSQATERDTATMTAWSQAQLLPEASTTLFNQVGKAVPHVAGVVDVFTLAGMLRNKEQEEELSGELVRMPRVTRSEMEKRGWTMASAASPSFHAALPLACASTPPSTVSGTVVPLAPPHPTVFLFARDYVEGFDSLTILLEERWGRDVLPLTVVPKWAHYAPAAATVMRSVEVRRLEEHVSRWLSGRAKVEKRKRRLVEERVAAEVTLLGAAAAAPVGEDRQRLTEHDAADIAWAIADALEALHSQGLAHGNVKPNNVLVKPWAADAVPVPRKRVCLTDHLLPLFPDALVEPGAVLSVPGWRTRDTRGYACLKPHGATVLPHMFGGGPAGAPATDPASYTISGFRVTSDTDSGDRGASLAGGVEELSIEAYEAVLLQHFAAPENVLLVVDNVDTPEATGATHHCDNHPSAAGAAEGAGGEVCRVWVNQQSTTTASDAYALGVLLWSMLLGRLPPLPQYRRVVRDAAGRNSTTVASVEHGSPLPRSYTDVLARCVLSLFETRAGAAGAVGAKESKRLRELSIFLSSEMVHAHLSLLLAMARAGDVRLVTMDLLMRLLHTDPRHRLTIEELRQHAFFRAYGSRRHELRRRYEETQRAASLAARPSMQAADGRALMPRQMGALAAMVSRADPSLERCRSETSFPATAAAATKSDRRSSVSTAELSVVQRSMTAAAAGTAAATTTASLAPARPRSAYMVSTSSPATALANAAQRSSTGQKQHGEVGCTFGEEAWKQSCFLGSAPPSLVRRGSDSNNNTNSCKHHRGRHNSGASRSASHSPNAVATAGESHASVGATAVEKSPSAPMHTPSVPPAIDDRSGSSPLGLQRTKTFNDGRRYTALRPIASVMSPLHHDESPPSPVMSLLSMHSSRLAPLAPETSLGNGEKTTPRHPLGPRRPAVRIRLAK